MNEITQLLTENRIQVFALLGSLFLFFFILKLILNKKLKEEYALLWLLSSLVFTLLSVFKPLLDWVANVAGIYYAPAALLLLLILGIVVILIHYSTVISKLSEQNKILTQELALLKVRIEKSEDEKS